jgi:hypothetical protein
MPWRGLVRQLSDQVPRADNPPGRPRGVSIKRLTRTFALKKLVVTMQLAGVWSLREKASISSSIP